jgi:hypothetical protein
MKMTQQDKTAGFIEENAALDDARPRLHNVSSQFCKYAAEF